MIETKKACWKSNNEVTSDAMQGKRVMLKIEMLKVVLKVLKVLLKVDIG